MLAPRFAIKGKPFSQKAMSVVVPPTSKEMLFTSGAARASMPRTEAAGPVNTASTGCSKATLKGNVPPSAFKICTGAVMPLLPKASCTFWQNLSKTL